VPLFRLLFILFLTVPLLEITILIQVGSAIGVVPTVLLCIFTAALGAGLIRIQGLQTLLRVRRKLEQHEVPAVDLVGGLILLIAGMLLLTPGFFTDFIGFLCLVPKLRDIVARRVVRRLIENARRNPDNRTIIVDGEFWEEGDQQKRLRH
jgi:UPF0716 protein FxsA